MHLARGIVLVSLLSLTLSNAAQDLHRIDSIIGTETALKNISGGVAYIYYKDRVVLDKAYGYADLGDLRPMKTNSLFRIASQTKAIVSIALLQLVDENKLQLDDPVEKYIPAFSQQQVAVWENDTFRLVKKIRSVTIRDLLTHTSGIASVEEYPKYKALFEKYRVDQRFHNSYPSLKEEVDQIAAMPLVHQPGARFSYGLSTNVIGQLIELLSGLPLDRYLSKNIFKPLAMRDTYFYLPRNKKERLVKVYARLNKDSLKELDPAIFPVDYPLQPRSTYFSAIGGLVSTTHDFARFLICLLNNGKAKNGMQLISPKLLNEFWSNQLGDKTFVFGGAKSLNNFGLGVGLTTKAGQIINNASEGSFFWGGALNTAYMVDRKRHLITLFYFQRYPFVLAPLLSKLEKTAIQAIDEVSTH